MKPSRNYHDDLIQDLKSSEESSAYLNAALEAGHREAFLLALRNVIEAQGGILKVARFCKLHRVSLYKILSKNGNPGLTSLMAIFNALGIQFQVAPKKQKLKKAA